MNSIHKIINTLFLSKVNDLIQDRYMFLTYEQSNQLVQEINKLNFKTEQSNNQSVYFLPDEEIKFLDLEDQIVSYSCEQDKELMLWVPNYKTGA